MGKVFTKSLQGLLILHLLLNTGFGQVQGGGVMRRTQPLESKISADQVVLRMVASAYLARVYDNSMPAWQADLLALSSVTLWEVTDHLVYGKRDGFRGQSNSHMQSLHYAAIGILLNRSMPLILRAGGQFIKRPFRENMSLRIDPDIYPKILLALDL